MQACERFLFAQIVAFGKDINIGSGYAVREQLKCDIDMKCFIKAFNHEADGKIKEGNESAGLGVKKKICCFLSKE